MSGFVPGIYKWSPEVVQPEPASVACPSCGVGIDAVTSTAVGPDLRCWTMHPCGCSTEEPSLSSRVARREGRALRSDERPWWNVPSWFGADGTPGWACAYAMCVIVAVFGPALLLAYIFGR